MSGEVRNGHDPARTWFLVRFSGGEAKRVRARHVVPSGGTFLGLGHWWTLFFLSFFPFFPTIVCLYMIAPIRQSVYWHAGHIFWGEGVRG